MVSTILRYLVDGALSMSVKTTETYLNSAKLTMLNQAKVT